MLDHLDPIAAEIELEAEALRAHARATTQLQAPRPNPSHDHILAFAQTGTEAIACLVFAAGVPFLLMALMGH